MASNGLPAHKLIPQTGFIVDGFKYKSPAIKAYFLSHAHSDHYTGLRDTWDYGLIYCSEVTGKLVARIAGVNPKLIRPLQWDTPTVIEGVEVTVVDANHCPGAAQLLFRLPSGESYVHCGDMRFGAHLLENPHLQRLQGCNAVFLDTTYCNPRYTFPPQEEAVNYIASTIHGLLTKDDGKRRLFLIQTYVIGKEHILIEVFKRCGQKIHLSERKLAVMQCLDMPGIEQEVVKTSAGCEKGLVTDEIFTTDPDETNIHLTQWGWLGESWPFFRPNFKNMELARKEMGVDEVIGFCPTGWMYEMKKKMYPVRSKGVNSIHLVPYSEHSSYNELREYVRFLKPHKVIPTVNVEGEDADKNRRAMLKHFRNLVDETASKASFLAAFSRTCGAKKSAASSDLSEADERDSLDQPAAGRDCDEPSEVDAECRALTGNPEPGNVEMAGGNGAPANVQAETSRSRPQLGTDSLGAEAKSRLGSQIELSLRPWAEAPPEAEAVIDSRASDTPSPTMAPKNISVREKRARSERSESPPAASSDAKEYAQERAQVVGVLGSAISNEAARLLLHQHSGNVERVLNAFYDGSNENRLGGSTGKKVNPAKPQPTPKAKAPKRKQGANKAAAASKKAKLAADQRQITAFFSQTGRSPESAAKTLRADPASQPIILDEEVEKESLRGSQEGGGAVPTSEPQRHHGKPKLKLPPAPKPARTSKSPSPGTLQEDSRCEEVGGARAAGLGLSSTKGQAGTSGTAKGRQKNGEPGVSTSTRDRSSEVPWDAVLKSVREYDPVGLAIWGEGQAAPYLHVSRALAAMDSTTKRLRISDVIANMFRSLLALSPDDILPAAYLVTGKLAPDYEGVEMSVGGSTISAAVVEATGVTRQRLSALYKKYGDLGDVVQACRHNQGTLHKPASLTIRGVFKTMRQIASEKGGGSAARKQRAVLSLLRSAREEEPKYLVRTLISNLRVGANWRSVIPGLARAFVVHEKGPGASKAEMHEASSKVSEAFHLCPNLDVLVPALREGGLQELDRRCTLKAGVPLKPMLAKICEGIPDALRQLRGAFLAEFKYDGMRSQIHLLPDGSVRIFSRNCEDRTAAYPDVVEIIQQACTGGARELVMDAELVAVDRADNNRLRAFQELATRARGHVEVHQVSVQVCVFVFDLLMTNGEVLLKESLRRRHAKVSEALPNLRPGFIEMAQSLEFEAPDVGPQGQAEAEEVPSREAEVHTYLLESFASGTEGLMLKALDLNATYQASKRSENWLKLKRDYCEGLRDSLDLVPIGAWYGQGRKTGWFSPFLMAAWDPEKEEFQSVCRCMSGFTDAFYTQATARLTQTICERKSYYNTGEGPSVWFEPREVWEIRGADLTISPVHRAAIGCIEANRDRGVSLRFPRFICIRDDKSTEDASSPEVIVDLYNKQTRKMSSAKEMLRAQQKRDTAEDSAQQGVSGDDSEDEEQPHENALNPPEQTQQHDELE